MQVLGYDKKQKATKVEHDGKILLIPAEAAAKMRVKLTDEIPDEILDELLSLSEEILCRQYLYDYAAKFVKTKRGYYTKLLEKGYSKSAAQKAVESAENYGIINDRVFAKSFVETNRSKKGRFALKNELSKKGVSAEIIDEVLSDMEPQDEQLVLLVKKLAKGGIKTREEKAKLCKKLISRGFSYDEIKRAVAEIFSDDFED